MAIEKAKESLARKLWGCCVFGAHKGVHTVLHPRTGAAAELVYAVHSLTHADGWTTTAIYVVLSIIALAHVIWVHMES